MNVPAIHVETTAVAMIELTATRAHVSMAILEHTVNTVSAGVFVYKSNMQSGNSLPFTNAKISIIKYGSVHWIGMLVLKAKRANWFCLHESICRRKTW